MKYQSIKKRTLRGVVISDLEVAKSLIPSDIHYLLVYKGTNVVHSICIYNTIFEAKRFPALRGWIQEMQKTYNPDISDYDIQDEIDLSYRDIEELANIVQEVLLDRSKAHDLFPNTYLSYMDKREVVVYPIEQYYWDYMKELYDALREITKVAGNEEEEFVYQVQEPWA